MNAEFKVFYNNVAATEAQLGEIDSITVEQQIDRVWEARIRIPVCMTSEGVWKTEDVPAYGKFSRVRVEARVGTGEFVPLIDGRIVGNDAERSSIPGKSVVTLIVHDDSSRLHRRDEVVRYQVDTDSDAAKQIFDAAKLGGTPEVEKTPPPPAKPPELLQRGTKMQMLRALAARHQDFYAYVLPGKEPGESIGCFKQLPVKLDEKLPPLLMFGEDANLLEFNVRENHRSPSNVVAAALNLRDKSITTGNSSYRDAALLSEESVAGAEKKDEETEKRLSPKQSGAVDLESATKGAANRSSYSLEADGKVSPLCYAGVLSPYRVVAVRLSDSRFSANYIVFKVVHTINASSYTQSFSVKGNAVSPPAKASASAPAASAGISVGINIQFGIH